MEACCIIQFLRGQFSTRNNVYTGLSRDLQSASSTWTLISVYYSFLPLVTHLLANSALEVHAWWDYLPHGTQWFLLLCFNGV